MKLIKQIKNILSNFSASTNIHGFSYIVQPKRWKIEQFFWIFSIVLSLALTGLLIYKLMLENQNNPTIIYTDQNVIHASEIIFPSLTFIPGLILKTPLKIGIDYEGLKNQLLSKKIKFENLSMNQRKKLQIASLIARDGFMSEHYGNVTISTNDLIKIMREDFPSFWRLREKDKNFRFDNIADFMTGLWWSIFALNFTEVLCPTGFCYTYNFPSKIEDFINPEIIHDDFNYKNFYRVVGKKILLTKLENNESYPLKGTKNGVGLEMRIQDEHFIDHSFLNKTEFFNQFLKASEAERDLLFDKQRTYYEILEHSLPQHGYFGLPLTIHGPYEVISDRTSRYYTQRNYNMKVLITPQVSHYDETLLELDADARQCYLSEEKKLKFFTSYNRVNCEHEFLANLTLKSCNCVQFFMVRDKETKICGISDEKCFRKVEKEYQKTKDESKCYQLCERIDYDVEVKADMKQVKLTSSRLDVKFAVNKILPTSRRKQQTIVGFLSLIGGFFGLFAGFSVLSGFEMLYYFAFEPILCKFRKNDNQVHPFQEEDDDKNYLKSFGNKFLSESSIHGLNHIGNEKESIIERLIWLLLFAFAMVGSYFMVIQVYQSLQTNQIMMTMEARVTNVEDIPFPAITFTNKLWMHSFELDVYCVASKNYESIENATMMHRIVKFYLPNGTNLNTIYNQVYANTCPYAAVAQWMKMFRFTYSTSSQFVDQLKINPMRNLWSRVQNSSWNFIQTPKYAETLTWRGLSSTFNIIEDEKLLNFSQLSTDFRYKYPATFMTSSSPFPWKTSSGEQKGLNVDIINHRHTRKDYLRIRAFTTTNLFGEDCSVNTFGVHGYNELPLGINFIKLIEKVTYDVLITPEIVIADDDLRSVNIDKRKCYFDDERKLKYYKIYTQKNCEMECLSHVAYRKCGCVPFYYLRDKFMRVCDYKTYRSCFVGFDDNIDFDDLDDIYKDHKVCKCYPPCSYITYTYDTREFYSKNHGESIQITFSYKDGDHFALLRYQPFKLVDFLSYVGGILGLFAGISVLSIVELFYYFTLRLLSNLIRHIKVV